MGPPLPPPLAPDVVGAGGAEEVALGADMVEDDDGAVPADNQYWCRRTVMNTKFTEITSSQCQYFHDINPGQLNVSCSGCSNRPPVSRK